MRRPCLDCGVLTDGKTRCSACTRARQRRRDAMRGSSAQRGYDAQYYRNRERVLASSPACVYCGRQADTVDHVLPVRLGGTSILDNLVPACRRCNLSRGAKLGNARRWHGSAAG